MAKSGEKSLHDLGAVEEAEILWRKLRRKYSKTTAKALYEQLFIKLDARFKKLETLYIAPDHFLNLLSFSQLVTPDNNYWVEGHTLIRQIRTGRHLLERRRASSRKTKGIVAVGGVPYDSFGNNTHHARPPNLVYNNTTRSVKRTALKHIGAFASLAQTGNEATAVTQRYWDESNSQPQLFLGDRATESNLKNLSVSPRVLHLATHGFYLPNRDSNIDRPMLLSGLALAGANRGINNQLGPDGEDGILFALEAQDLKLGGTELVVLSVCDTGNGTLDYSEGVYGLVRAFRIAGARNVMMSLWSLYDDTARNFMERFYINWLSGKKPRDLAIALRDTQRSFINDNDKGLHHPDAWAPYLIIESGN